MTNDQLVASLTDLAATGRARPPFAAEKLMLAADASGPENGALELVPGRQHRLLTPLPKASPRTSTLRTSRRRHHAAAPRRSGDLLAPDFPSLRENRSTSSRRALFFTFSPASAEMDRATYYAATRRRLLEQLPPERQAQAVFR